MDFSDICSFWNQHEQAIANALPQDIEAFAQVMQQGANRFDLEQEIEGHFIRWFTHTDDFVIMYCLIPDSRNLDHILDAYVQTKQRGSPLTVILVHQWTDGEGTWDIFLISPRTAMHHVHRLVNGHEVQEQGPVLRQDIYTLFTDDGEFTIPDKATWLCGPVDEAVAQLERLANTRDCHQETHDYHVQWKNPKGTLEAQFFFMSGPEDIEPFIAIYQYLKEVPCPVSFVFVPIEESGICDIFRLSARSYLEHHHRIDSVSKEGENPMSHRVKAASLNSDKATINDRSVCHAGKKVWLSSVQGWSSSEKVSSVHAAFEAVAQAHGESLSYDFIVGISSVAFRMQFGRLCPSSPHPACGYICCGRASRLLPWQGKGYDIDQDGRKVDPELFEVIVDSIDAGIPVVTGEEEEGLIIGYQPESRELYCLHPHEFDGQKPFVIKFQDLHKICWNICAYTEPRNESVDRQALIVESLQQAVTMAHQERADSYDLGFKAWEVYIHTLEKQKKFSNVDMLGNAWIYECLVQYRQIAAWYLREICGQFSNTSQEHLHKAADLYQKISAEVLTGDMSPTDVAPYPDSLKKGEKWTKEKRQKQIKRLQQALPLEIRAVEEIEKALSSVTK